MSMVIIGCLVAIFLLGLLISLVSAVYCIFVREYNDKVGHFFLLFLFCLACVVLIFLLVG